MSESAAGIALLTTLAGYSLAVPIAVVLWKKVRDGSRLKRVGVLVLCIVIGHLFSRILTRVAIAIVVASSAPSAGSATSPREPTSPVVGRTTDASSLDDLDKERICLEQRAELTQELELANGISVALSPRWQIFSAEERALVNPANADPNETLLPFAANLFDSTSRAVGIMNLRIYPAFDVTQREVESLSAADLAMVDREIYLGISESLEASPLAVVEWHGTQRVWTGDVSALVTEYRRTDTPDEGFFRVRLVRVFMGSRSFTLTVSYLEGCKDVRLRTSRIIESLKVEGR